MGDNWLGSYISQRNKGQAISKKDLMRLISSKKAVQKGKQVLNYTVYGKIQNEEFE